jgi:hypothetical protein
LELALNLDKRSVGGVETSRKDRGDVDFQKMSPAEAGPKAVSGSDNAYVGWRNLYPPSPISCVNIATPKIYHSPTTASAARQGVRNES